MLLLALRRSSFVVRRPLSVVVRRMQCSSVVVRHRPSCSDFCLSSSVRCRSSYVVSVGQRPSVTVRRPSSAVCRGSSDAVFVVRRRPSVRRRRRCCCSSCVVRLPLVFRRPYIVVFPLGGRRPSVVVRRTPCSSIVVRRRASLLLVVRRLSSVAVCTYRDEHLSVIGIPSFLALLVSVRLASLLLALLVAMLLTLLLLLLVLLMISLVDPQSSPAEGPHRRGYHRRHPKRKIPTGGAPPEAPPAE